MKCSEVLGQLFELAPVELAEDWDNVGLLIGRPEKEIRRIYLAVDATDDVIEHAEAFGADLLLTHHPMIFKPMKKITGDDFIGRRALELIRNDISYIALHTNFDIACMAEAAADRLGLNDTEVLEVTHETELVREGLGRVGSLPRIMSLSECAELVKKLFNLQHVKVFGNPDDEVETVAILPGSGGSEISCALAHDADVYVTGDISHHEGLDANMQGLSIIDAGHYGIEKIFMEYMQNYFRKNMPEMAVRSESAEIPFRIL
ncbi:dinuclear metal center protein, YbgI/SA1388 family [Lachnospiraceae bacterium]|nr:dinuclear metal center protein, YbgI/SA1388 family [Lachnospiraceae bacterium]